ncbi:MAG: hypothetical protein SF187_01405 [Deltaproteobacteria bacterium]|nr:hypothetical protein [Deltaproteobacteria bacterium]
MNPLPLHQRMSRAGVLLKHASLLRCLIFICGLLSWACSGEEPEQGGPVDASIDGNDLGDATSAPDGLAPPLDAEPKPDGGDVPAPTITVEPVAARPNWNDYGAASDPTLNCGPSDDAFGLCKHYGAIRRAKITGTSCDGLVMKDELGVFDWTCENSASGAEFVGHLRADRGLADLVTASGWKPNRVIVSGRRRAVSELAAWWSNPVRPLPANADGCTPSLGVGCDAGQNFAKLEEAGAVYVAAADQRSRGYAIVADGVSVVTLGNAVVSLVEEGLSFVYPPTDQKAPNYAALFLITDRERVWIEGSFDRRAANVSTLGLWAVRMRHSHIRRTGWANFGNAALELWDCHANIFWDTRIFNAGYALYLEERTSFNAFTGVRISSSRSTVSIGDGCHHNMISGASIIHTVWGITLEGDANLVANVLVHDAGAGIFFGSGRNLSVSQAALLDIVGNSLGVSGANSLAFSGDLLVGAQATCNPGPDSPASFDTACRPLNQPQAQSEVAFQAGASAKSSFIGKVTNDDASPADVDGAAPYSKDLQWWPLQNPERAWGIEIAPAPATRKALCTPEDSSCLIFDWSLRINDTTLRSGTGRASTPAEPFVAGQPCPSSVNGSRTIHDELQKVTFLGSALELLGDGIGNDNGLCENKEACLYAPNFGAYQGHGALGSCGFVDGSATQAQGILLYGFESNGR